MNANKNYLSISDALKEIHSIEDQVYCGYHSSIDFFELYD